MGPNVDLVPFWTKDMGLTENLYVDVKDKGTQKTIVRLKASDLLPGNWFDLLDKLV